MRLHPAVLATTLTRAGLRLARSALNRRWAALGAAALSSALGVWPLPATAQTAPASSVTDSGTSRANPPPPASIDGPKWGQLSRAQQAALQPLTRDWNTLDSATKARWMALADRFSSMSPQKQARVQERMTEWAKLPPSERGRARLRYQQAQQVSPQERRARWNEYQQLSESERQALSDRAAARRQAAAASAAQRRTTTRAARGTALDSGTKSNLVPMSKDALVNPVSPTDIQAQPGATTVLVSKPPQPPKHLHPGQPKIRAASSPGAASAAAESHPSPRCGSACSLAR